MNLWDSELNKVKQQGLLKSLLRVLPRHGLGAHSEVWEWLEFEAFSKFLCPSNSFVFCFLFFVFSTETQDWYSTGYTLEIVELER